jgi:hypothetical protein
MQPLSGKGGIAKKQPLYYHPKGTACLALFTPPMVTLFLFFERIMQFGMMLHTKKVVGAKIDMEAIHKQESDLFIDFRNKYWLS